MIRLVLLFIWLKWRELVNRMRWKRRSDAVERVSRVAAILVPIVVGLIFAAGVAGAGVGAYLLGVQVGAGSEYAGKILFGMRIFVLAILGMMVIMIPIATSQQGQVATSARFVLLPIRRSRLHAVEVLAGIANSGVLFTVIVALALAAGVTAGGAGGGGAAAAAAGAGLALLVLSWGSLLTFTMQWLFRDRGRGELIVLATMIVLVAAGAIGPLMQTSKERAGKSGHAVRIDLRPGNGTGEWRPPAWAIVLPSELYVRTIDFGLEGRPLAAGLALAGLLGEGVLIFGLSSKLHGVLLETPAGGRRRRKAAVQAEEKRAFAIPGLSLPVAAVAMLQFRTAIRTPRGKLAVFFAGGLILLQAVALRRAGEATGMVGYVFRDGATLAVAAVFLSLMSLQAFLMNQFASDGDGLALEFLVPLSDVDIVRGKAVGGALLLLAAMVPCILAAALLAPGSPIIHWLAVPLAVASVYALVSPLAAFLSMHFPRKVDLARMGSAGNAHVAAALIGLVATIAAALPPVAIMGLIGSALGKGGLALGLTAAWTVLCTALCVPLLTGVARLAAGRRENLLLVARGR